MPATDDSAAPGPTARAVVARDTATVKRLAVEAGFDLVGVARYAPLDPAALDRWLSRGMHGRMAWMAEGRDARVDPAVLLPEVRSVVALAANYWHPGDTRLPGGGRVSRYAWGRDYHKELGGASRACAGVSPSSTPGSSTGVAPTRCPSRRRCGPSGRGSGGLARAATW